MKVRELLRENDDDDLNKMLSDYDAKRGDIDGIFKRVAQILTDAGFKVNLDMHPDRQHTGQDDEWIRNANLFAEKYGKSDLILTHGNLPEYHRHDPDKKKVMYRLRAGKDFWSFLITSTNGEDIIKYLTGPGKRYVGKKPDVEGKPGDRAQKPLEKGHEFEDATFKALSKKYESTSTKGKISFKYDDTMNILVYLNGYVRLEINGSDRLRMLHKPTGETDEEKMKNAFEFVAKYTAKLDKKKAK